VRASDICVRTEEKVRIGNEANELDTT